jgi:hypothetical protein
MGWNHPSFLVAEVSAEACSRVDCADSIMSGCRELLCYGRSAQREETRKARERTPSRTGPMQVGVGEDGVDLDRIWEVEIDI